MVKDEVKGKRRDLSWAMERTARVRSIRQRRRDCRRFREATLPARRRGEDDEEGALQGDVDGVGKHMLRSSIPTCLDERICPSYTLLNKADKAEKLRQSLPPTLKVNDVDGPVKAKK
ncbi:hypothetical protein OF846_004504 [Rhodotorula toruloides]|nr:hypothetical protein OF846_004504 [Rhodotorula toruloides]